MPSAAIGAISSFLVAAGASAAVATFVAKVFVYAAATYLLNRASKLLAPKPRGAGLGTGSEINYYDSGASVRIAYGRVRTGGMETIPPITSGADSAFLHKTLTLTGHEIDSYNYTHFDVDTIANAAIGPMAFTTSDGRVNSGPFREHAWIRHYRGTATDSADRILIGVDSTAFGNARARGIAKVSIQFKFNQDIFQSIPTITFTYQGKRCYDPRLDATPGANPTNASYIVWTQNPALCLADYLMSSYGGEYAASEIDWASVVTAATSCDVSVSVPSGVQPRYTCNGVIFAAEAFTENVKALTDAMLGRVIFSDGRWRMYAGSWQTPTFTIQKSDWVSGLSIRFEQGREKRFNRMKCWYVDREREYQRVECNPRFNATYRAADGAEDIETETEQLLCDNEFEAQRKTEFLLRQSRNQIMVIGRLPPRFQNIALWDTGTIVFDHLGWSSKTFRAVGIDMNPDGSMDCAFAEEQSSDWTDMPSVNYNSASIAALPAPNVTTPSAPQSFSVSSQVNGTLMFEWTTPIVRPAGTRFQIIRSVNSSNAAVGTVVWEGDAMRVSLVMPTSPHFYYVRAITNSLKGPYQPNSFGIRGIARIEADYTRAQRIVPDGEFSFGPSTSYWYTINAQSATYVVTSEQAGGYFNIRAGGSNANLRSIHDVSSIGAPAGIGPHALHLQTRFRINAIGTDREISFGVRMMGEFPNTSPRFIGGQAEVINLSSKSLGTWHDVSADIPVFMNLRTSSGEIGYFQPSIATPTSCNIDIARFTLDDRGFVNQPLSRLSMTAPTMNLQLQNAMRLNAVSSAAAPGTINLLTNAGSPAWLEMPIGARWYCSKGIVTTSPIYIHQASGTIMRLSGTASVGTRTIPAGICTNFTIQRTGDTEFIIDGSGIA